jgi:hypothetical protein
MVYRYVPLLRAKAGEATALINLTPAAKDRMFPILHLPAATPTTFVARLGPAWAGRRLGLDGLYNYDTTGSGAAMQGTFNGLTAAGVVVVPCVEYGAPPGYLTLVSGLAHSAGTGLVVKVRLGHLGAVTGWLATGAWQPHQVDLVVMAGHVADFGHGVLDQLVLHSLQTLPNATTWRSVTLAGSAAPKDMSNLGLGANMVPRLDWQLWSATAGQLPYQVDFGDHGISHPDMTEPPGFVMGSATVSVRYTLDDHWLVIKGRPVTGNTGIPMGAQYSSHAATLSGSAGFGGLLACWGDNRIGLIVSGSGTPGSRQTWVEIGANRHLSLVADRLP